jgi:hypothetical protein
LGAVYDENTGEEPCCPICSSVEGCDHLVAVIDKTFGECHGGTLYNRHGDIFSLIEDVFEKLSRAGEDPSFSDPELGALWEASEFEEDGDTIWVHLSCGGWPFLISLLEGEGAIYPSNSIIEEGPPGLSSAMAYLYDDNPSVMLDAAKDKLKANLADVVGA